MAVLSLEDTLCNPISSGWGGGGEGANYGHHVTTRPPLLPPRIFRPSYGPLSGRKFLIMHMGRLLFVHVSF